MNRMIAIGLALCLAGLSYTVHAAPAGAGPLTATLLWYEEQEAGTDTYPVRIIVSTGFVRIDDADDNGDFVLLDRANRNLYSVSHEDRSILVIAYRAHARELPAGLRLDEEIEADDAAPSIAGRRPLLVSLRANDTICYRVAAVPGLLDDAVAGLAEYARVLGNRQRGNLSSVPAEMQTPCFLSGYVYAPDRHLRHGLPIQEWDQAGYRRALVDYRSGEQVAQELFELPEGYQRIRLEGGGL